MKKWGRRKSGVAGKARSRKATASKAYEALRGPLNFDKQYSGGYMTLRYKYTSLLFALLVAALIVLGPVFLMGSGPQLQRSEANFTVDIINTSSTTGACFFQDSGELFRRQDEVRIVNMSTDALYKVYIASFSTVDETAFGWPIYGGEKEVHPIGPNVKVCVWHGDATATAEVRAYHRQ